MDITSLQFLFLFLPVFCILYAICKKQVRLLLITVASLVFLAWGNGWAGLWLIFILLISYSIGLALSGDVTRKALWVWLGIGINLLVLFVFKWEASYQMDWVKSLGLPGRLQSPSTNLIIPIGISFVTFQAISYLVDVRRGTLLAERSLIRFAAYLLFFPKLVSGPIMRYGAFQKQLDDLSPSADMIAAGIRRVFIGFIKRALIANQIGVWSDAVFNLTQPAITPSFAWLAIVAYTMQIYFDFAGYTDMAIGLGQMIGIQLPENFNYPYIARSVSDFWRRWHISLTAWFREYVFYPLERRRFRWSNLQLNILIVFLLTGLWHGLKPTFIAWGLLHGLFLAIESLGFGRWLGRLWRPLQHVYAMSIVMAGWVLFRSPSLDFAALFFRRLAGDTTGVTLLPFSLTSPFPFLDLTVLLALLAAIFFSFPVGQLFQPKGIVPGAAQAPLVVQAGVDMLLILLFVLGLAASLSQAFLPNIYASF